MSVCVCHAAAGRKIAAAQLFTQSSTAKRYLLDSAWTWRGIAGAGGDNLCLRKFALKLQSAYDEIEIALGVADTVRAGGVYLTGAMMWA